MKDSPRKIIKFNKIRPPGQTLSTLQVDKQKENNIEKNARSLDMRDNKDPQTTYSLDKSGTGTRGSKMIQPRTFQNRIAEGQNNKKMLRMELRCVDSGCDDDSSSLISYGGYSVKSREKKNDVVHNHRKLNRVTVYDFAQDQVPQIYDQLLYGSDKLNPQKDDNSKSKFPYPKLPKFNWKLSSFAPVFVNKNPHIQPSNLQRQVEHQQNRQRKEIEKYELQRQIQVQKKNQEKEKMRRNLKTNTQLESAVKDQKAQGNNRNNNRYENIIQSSGKEKIKTRLQQRQEDLSGFEISQRPQPCRQANFCYPCHMKIEDYWQHIESPEHKVLLRRSVGTDYFHDQMKHLQNVKNEELNSEEYKYLEYLDKYLEGVAHSLESMLLKKNAELKQRMKQINAEIQRWAKR